VDITTQQQYNILYQKTLKGMQWLDSADRTDAEQEKWGPRIKVMFDETTRLERLMRNENEAAKL
jgi:hypothetical protein